MTTLDTRPPGGTISTTLRTLYLARFAFAVVWAVLVVLTAATLGPLSVALLLLYPVVDLAAAVVDHRASRTTTPAPALYVNMALSLLAAVGLAFAVTSGLLAVLVVWGAWAITAGAVQLVVALGRRALGGQWPMILSGAISVLAGAGFVARSGTPAASLADLAGYATLGGIFFLVSALRLAPRTDEQPLTPGRRRTPSSRIVLPPPTHRPRPHPTRPDQGATVTTKITLIIDNPTDPAAFEQAYPALVTAARALPGLQRLESAKVWPKEDGTPTPAHRTLDLYFESYDDASAAVAGPEAGAFFSQLGATGTGFTGLFSDVEA